MQIAPTSMTYLIYIDKKKDMQSERKQKRDSIEGEGFMTQYMYIPLSLPQITTLSS